VATAGHFLSPIKIKKGEAKRIPFFGEIGEVVFPADKSGWLKEEGWNVRFAISREAFSESRIEGGARGR
jgi:hypothetical protein